MNQRFDDLLYEAGLTAQGCWDQMDDYDRAAVMKFAQLIVRECAEVAGCNSHVAGFALGDLIREHFGVKE